MTPRCRRILEQSILESRKNNCETVGSEHILMSLLREKDCYAVRFLAQLGADPIILYRQLCQAMDFSGDLSSTLPLGQSEGSQSLSRKKNLVTPSCWINSAAT